MTRLLAVAAVLWIAVLPSCIAVGGTQNDHPATAGKQLIDLKAALDAGAMTPAEYETKKAQILASK